MMPMKHFVKKFYSMNEDDWTEYLLPGHTKAVEWEVISWVALFKVTSNQELPIKTEADAADIESYLNANLPANALQKLRFTRPGRAMIKYLNDSRQAHQGRFFNHRGAWIPDLTMQCVEPNPGPLFEHMLVALTSQAGDVSKEPWDNLLFYFQTQDSTIKTLADTTSEDFDRYLPHGEEQTEFLRSLGFSRGFIQYLVSYLEKQRNQSDEGSASMKKEYLTLVEDCKPTEIADDIDELVVQAIETIQQIIQEKTFHHEGLEQFPVSTSSKSQSYWSPFLMDPPLCQEISKEFRNVVRRSVADNGQNRYPILLYQTSLMGKTKLCFTLGLSEWVIMLRGIEHSFLPFYQVLDGTMQIMESLRYEVPTRSQYETLGECVVRNQCLLECWIQAHFDFLKRFVVQAESLGITPEDQKQYFLRLTTNGGLGRQCLEQMWWKRVENLSQKQLKIRPRWELPPVSNLHIVFDDMVYFPGHQSAAEFVFPHSSDQRKFLEVGQHQLGEYKTQQQVPPSQCTTNLTYAVFQLAGQFLDEGIATIFTSTRMKAAQMLQDQNFAKGSRPREFYIYTPTQKVELNQLKELFAKYLGFRVEHKRINDMLREFEGSRPGFFFDYVWEPLGNQTIGALQQGKQVNLLQVVETVLADGTERIKDLLRKRLDRLVSEDADARLNLIYFLQMRGGKFFLDPTDTDVLEGLGVITNTGPLIGGPYKNFREASFSEPLVNKILRSQSVILFDWGGSSLFPDYPDEDEIFQWLYKSNEQPSEVAELVVVRIFQRSSGSLMDLFQHREEGLEGPGVNDSIADYQKNLPEWLADLTFSRELTCGTAAEHPCDEVDHLLGRNPYVVVRMSNAARPDICFPLTSTSTSVRQLLPSITQVKWRTEHMIPSILCEALDSLFPANFWTTNNTKEHTNPRPDPLFPQKRKKFESCADIQKFKQYVRIVASWSGFSAACYNIVSQFNQKNPHQPIILFTPPKHLTHSALWERLTAKVEVKASHQVTPVSIDKYRIESLGKAREGESEDKLAQSEPVVLGSQVWLKYRKRERDFKLEVRHRLH
eukprot:TRINITY_DN12516_c0_g1_i1.p1 TRINITY_DN12516_c0_g1~~TRINITY_DN12516_c0_g1_i1.p1  ORF type:complete len:1052 (+),score=116.55 TRINITY_DN12516_c0_g1_i1:3833-6988(+)